MVFEYFSKFYRENSSFIENRKERKLLYIKTNTFFIISRLVLLRMKNVSHKSCGKNRFTHFIFNTFYIQYILYSIYFLKKSCLYKIMCKNIIELGRPQLTIRRERIACWIPRATNTLSICVILVVFYTVTMRALQRLIVTLQCIVSLALCMENRSSATCFCSSLYGEQKQCDLFLQLFVWRTEAVRPVSAALCMENRSTATCFCSSHIRSIHLP